VAAGRAAGQHRGRCLSRRPAACGGCTAGLAGRGRNRRPGRVHHGPFGKSLHDPERAVVSPARHGGRPAGHGGAEPVRDAGPGPGSGGRARGGPRCPGRGARRGRPWSRPGPGTGAGRWRTPPGPQRRLTAELVLAFQRPQYGVAHHILGLSVVPGQGQGVAVQTGDLRGHQDPEVRCGTPGTGLIRGPAVLVSLVHRPHFPRLARAGLSVRFELQDPAPGPAAPRDQARLRKSFSS
jgi:hypothetical protein